MATSVLVTTIDHATDKTQVKSLTNINPEASAAKLAQWIQDGVALSKDSFVSATLITEEALTSIDTRADRTLRMLRVTGMTSAPAVNLTRNDQNIYDVSIPLSSIASNAPVIKFWIASNTFPTENIIPVTNMDDQLDELSWRTPSNTAGGWQSSWTPSLRVSYEAQSFQVKVTFPETDSYAALTITYNINITEE